MLFKMDYRLLLVCSALVLLPVAFGHKHQAVDVENELLFSEDSHNERQLATKFKCPWPFGTFHDPDGCAHYYVCVMGKGKRLPCPPSFHFDFFRRTCLHKLIAVCFKDKDKTTETPTPTEETTTTINPDKFVCPGIVGRFADPKDCSRYYLCAVYIASLKTCPEGELFDGVRRECQPAEHVHCGSRVRPTQYPTPEIPAETTSSSPDEESQSTTDAPDDPTTGTSDDDTTTGKPDDTTTGKPDDTTTGKPDDTTTGKPDDTTTGKPDDDTTTGTSDDTTGTSDDETSTIEEDSTSTTNEIISTTTEQETRTWATAPPETTCDEEDLDCRIDDEGDPDDWFRCPDHVGYYPHPTSKRMFIFCMNWKPSVKKCGQDMVFSTRISRCMPPE